MNNQVIFDKDLISRYDCSGPRYTSYPTAVQFNTDYGPEDYYEWADNSNDDPIPTPLSLYLHIPFCDTICYYCGCSKIVTKDKDKAPAYVELLKKEIALQGKLFDKTRPVVQIHWGGGTPTFLDNETIGDIFDCMRQHFTIPEGDDGEFGIEVDPRTVDEERIAFLRSVGFNRISFGVQDFDPDVQEAVNRVHTKEQIVKVIEAARKNDFHSINIDLMYGLPKQTLASFEKTIQSTIEASPDRLAVYNYAHMPEMFKPQRRINDEDLPKAEEKLQILQMTIEKLQQAGYAYIGMDHFAKQTDDLTKAQQQGTLHRNFQGYSTHADCDTVAMGITAISRIGDNYSQNVRTVEDYKASIEQGKIPVFRGIELEADDILRREIINQLMCNNQLNIKAIEERWGFDFKKYFASALPALNRMVEDGLIIMDKQHIEVTPSGRLLARIISMEFDRYLKKDLLQKRYSKVI
ncbi:MAG: oxygen-independent coproporphyrinogen III oxidase [Gammaproteobacteria bacterium]|nr:oxygen-independent coproporphyrinogen III oxidase [Gammaproteobacteria bacterium]